MWCWSIPAVAAVGVGRRWEAQLRTDLRRCEVRELSESVVPTARLSRSVFCKLNRRNWPVLKRKENENENDVKKLVYFDRYF